MSKVSRRALSRYAVDQLLTGHKPKALAQALAAALAESGRASEYQFLLNDINWELEHRQILASGQVTSAFPLSQKLAAELKTQIKKATKVKEVFLESEIDKTVLGGFRVETSGRIWDETLKTKLLQLRENV